MEVGCVRLWPLLRDRVMSAHDVYRPKNGKTPQSIPASFQYRSASVVLSDGWPRPRRNCARLFLAQ